MQHSGMLTNEWERKSENHVNSKKTHSKGVYYITIFGKSSRDNTKKSKQRELNVNKHWQSSALFLRSFGLGSKFNIFLLNFFCAARVLHLSINYPKEFSDVLVELTFYSNRLKSKEVLQLIKYNNRIKISETHSDWIIQYRDYRGLNNRIQGIK